MFIINNYQSVKLFKSQALNLILEDSYILGVLGPNNSGKTHFIESIILRERKSTGSISLNGEENFRKELSYIPSEFPYEKHLKIKQIEKFMSLVNDNFSKDTFRNYLDRYELSINETVKKLSLGQKQRLMIALSLSSKAKLIIMDEPTEGLDPFILDEIIDDLREYVILNNANCIVITHQTTAYEDFFDHILYMEDSEYVLNLDYPDFIRQSNNYLDTKLDKISLHDFVSQRQKEQKHDPNS